VGDGGEQFLKAGGVGVGVISVKKEDGVGGGGVAGWGGRGGRVGWGGGGRRGCGEGEGEEGIVY
jgi:hypothetical protein